MQSMRNIIRRSWLYKSMKRFQARRALLKWTAEDQKLLIFYSQFIKPGVLCFDVGANVGTRVKIFHKLHAYVIAVEPQDECARILREAYEGEQRVTVIQQALGESAGEAEIMISDVNTISSLAPEWIEAVSKSGRFSEYRWDKKKTVPMTTLDRLIEQYGTPAFIKIDVEGYEFQVLKGLSRPVNTLSLEFTPEFIDSSLRCINHLQQLGEIRLNYSFGERLALSDWSTPQEMTEILSRFKDNLKIFGDIYVRFQLDGD